MRAAVFTPYLPYPPDTGGKTRSYYMVRALATRLEVDLYTVFYGEGPAPAEVDAVQQFCRQVAIFRLDKPWRTRARLQRALAPLPRSVDYFHTADSLQQARCHLATGGYDLVIADEICMTPYAELAPHLPRMVLRQKVDYLHYQEMAQARPWSLDKVLDSLEAIKLRRYERAKMPLYQAFVACTDYDAMVIGRDAPNTVPLVIPNGADLSSFVPAGHSKAKDPTLLYVGAMHYYPNADAVSFFFEAMYERIRQAVPGVRVQIVGHAPPPDIQRLARFPGVEVTGSVADVRPYYEEATVFIVPLRLGGGTRLKIIEAMAMGLPAVSTTVGAEGLSVQPGEDILIADGPASFSESVLRLLADAELRERIARSGQRLARHYDWNELCKPYIELAERVIWQGRKDECASPG
jgi:glycosyltransferase involved in cell wall biosynthesis